MIALPGSDSYRVTAIPSRSRMPARKSAALRVSPGGFDVSIRTYCCSRRTMSSEARGAGACCAAANDTETGERKKKDAAKERKKEDAAETQKTNTMDAAQRAASACASRRGLLVVMDLSFRFLPL